MKIGDYLEKKRNGAGGVCLFSFLWVAFSYYDSLLLFHKKIFRYMTKTFFFSFVLNFLFCVFLRTVRVENHLGTTCQTFCSSRQFSSLGADKRIDAQENVYRTVYRHLFSDCGR